VITVSKMCGEHLRRIRGIEDNERHVTDKQVRFAFILMITSYLFYFYSYRTLFVPLVSNLLFLFQVQLRSCASL
jgi:hypothetical protein